MIPVFEPVIGDDEIAAVVAALRKGEISGSFGDSIPEFEASFAEFVGVGHAVAVTSGTAALHVAIAALDLTPGDEILMSASTNVATALAAFHNGLVTVPVDSEVRTWNLDLDLIESLIGPRTRAIVPVHLFGHPVDMDRLNEIAEKHDLVVIEDCAEAHGATCRGKMVGGLGHMACFSFYANKVITTGEGGMVTTHDTDLAERVRSLRNLAFTEPRFRHELAGFNFRMTGYQAAMGSVQLRKIDDVIKRKRQLASTYNEALSDIPGLRTPVEEEWAKNVYWMYAVTIEDSSISRDQLVEGLADAGIQTRTFFCPMDQQPFLLKSDLLRAIPCPVAGRLWETGLYLPSSPGLARDTIEMIGGHIRRLMRA